MGTTVPGRAGRPGEPLAYIECTMAIEHFNSVNADEGIRKFDTSEFTVIPGRTSWDGKEVYPCVLGDGSSTIAFTDEAYGRLFAARGDIMRARGMADYGKAKR